MRRMAVILTALSLPSLSLVSAAEDFESRTPTSIRIATFNIQELSQKKLDEIDANGNGTNSQLLNCAEILQRVRPDVVLLNEIDAPSSADDRELINPAGNAAELFIKRYLSVGHAGRDPLKYPFFYIAPSNTGVPTGQDLDNDGKTDGPADSFGFGRYPGEYGMALLSQFPILTDDVRTFRKLLWKDMPGNLMPDGKEGRPNFYNQTEINLFRLSSKSHWDVPVSIHGKVIHVLCSHPTPPVFDGPEDSNGRRNFDEIRFWADYLTGSGTAEWIHDDRGAKGGLASDAPFVILGDLNAEPVRGDAPYGKHHRIVDSTSESIRPTSDQFGGEGAAK